MFSVELLSVPSVFSACLACAWLKPLNPSHLEVFSIVRVPIHVWQSRATSLETPRIVIAGA